LTVTNPLATYAKVLFFLKYNFIFFLTSYAKNLQLLEKLVLVKFANDTVVDPRGTEWFDYYVPGQSEVMQTLRESDLYKVKNFLTPRKQFNCQA